MARPESLPASIDVVGELDLSSPDGVAFGIRGRGAAVELVASSFRDLLVVRKSLGRNPFRPWAVSAQKLVRYGDITVRVVVGSAEVIRLSPHSRGNWLSAVLGVAPAEVRIGGLVRSLVA